jgi:hypothetical protein
MRDLSRYRDEWQESFHFTFIDPASFTAEEHAVWEMLPQIFVARGGRPRRIRDIRVSETMRLMEGRYQEAVGVWEYETGQIIIKRTQLQSVESFAATVLHELSHALSGASDVSLEFEEKLSQELGTVVARQLASARP